ncbi:MAG TPA: GNAT family N-acetyltransferase, partial [Bryobacteraceae bacterium]
AFDPEYSTFGFGRTLLYHALRYAFETGYESWNFLRGNEPYKFDWGARSIPKARLLITRAG